MPLLSSLICLTACPADWPPLTDCSSDGCSSEPTSSGGPGAPTTAGPTETGTGSSGPGSETDATTGDTLSTDPAEELPPTIVELSLAPTPIFTNGPITISATALNADGIHVELDDGEWFDLTPDLRGGFGGEIVIASGLLNGPHRAWLTPFRDVSIEGDVVPADYEVMLPVPGEEGTWEAGDLIGKGQVAALGVLPDGEVIELGTRIDAGISRCYLRRRDAAGAWRESDVVPVLPEFPCTATDLAIGPDGELLVLVDRTGIDGKRWWLGRLADLNEPQTNLALGGEGETAKAVAVHASGTSAVCAVGAAGDTPDADGKVWVQRPGEAGLLRRRGGQRLPRVHDRPGMNVTAGA